MGHPSPCHHALWAALALFSLGCPPAEPNAEATLTAPGTTAEGEASTVSLTSAVETTAAPMTTTTGSTTETDDTMAASSTAPSPGELCGVGALFGDPQECAPDEVCFERLPGGDVCDQPPESWECVPLPPGCTRDDLCADDCKPLCDIGCPYHDGCGLGTGVMCPATCNEQDDCNVAGEACKPLWNGESWTLHTCVPAPDPGAKVGEPCTVSDGPGFDTCEPGAICFPNDSTCKPECNLHDSPACEACYELPSDFFDDPIGVCLTTCDPLMPVCLAGEACIIHPQNDQQFVCVSEYSGDEGAQFEACDYLNDCDPGLACVAPDMGPMACDPQASGCCVPYCDTTDPQCPQGSTCSPWFPQGRAPMGSEDVGYCGAA